MTSVGVFAPLVNGPIIAILQATIAPEMQGRVFTLLGSLAGATAPVGLLFAAPLAELTGAAAWFLAGGAMCVAMGVVGLLVPMLRRIEEARPPGG
jgi:DHA3 family macrolide efflux protein-like MFS transporter